MATVYVTGHRNPDTDSIAAAIGYAELNRRLDPRNDYVPVRLGDLNAQTRWVLERSGAPEPEFLPHVFLRVTDVMIEGFPTVSHREPIRSAGLRMAREDRELMPIVDDDGVGNRDDAQRRAIELGAALLITSNRTVPSDATLALARERGTTVVSSPWDSYVTSRMVTLSAPCRALMDAEPLTVRPDDLLADIAAPITGVDYRAAVAV